MKRVAWFLVFAVGLVQAGEETVMKVPVVGTVEARAYPTLQACKAMAREISRGLVVLEGGGASELHETADAFVLAYVGNGGPPKRHVDIFCYKDGEMRLYLLQETDKPVPPLEYWSR